MGNFVVYKLVDSLTGYTYIGIDKVSSREYLGMGPSLAVVLSEPTPERFTRENLHTTDTLKEAWKKEEKLVKCNAPYSDDNLNIYVGGVGELIGVGRVRCVENPTMVSRIITGDTINPITYLT